MSFWMTLLLATAPWNPVLPEPRQQDPSGVVSPQAPGTERLVIRKDGGPGRGPDQPYTVREQGATDLEGFVGGKQVVFVAPYDVFLVILLVALIVVLVIVL